MSSARPPFSLTFCPECGVPAEVSDRQSMFSTAGPVELARVACVVGHRFMMPTEGLPFGVATLDEIGR